MTYQKYRFCFELATMFRFLFHLHSMYFMLWYTQTKSWTVVFPTPTGKRWIKPINYSLYIFQISHLYLLLPSIKPFGLTCPGRFLDQFSVARALDHCAVGAGSTQQGVHSHSNIFHQIKLGTVCPSSCPDSLPIQRQNPSSSDNSLQFTFVYGQKTICDILWKLMMCFPVCLYSKLIIVVSQLLSN